MTLGLDTKPGASLSLCAVVLCPDCARRRALHRCHRLQVGPVKSSVWEQWSEANQSWCHSLPPSLPISSADALGTSLLIKVSPQHSVGVWDPKSST